jgi:hypothetical protein
MRPSAIRIDRRLGLTFVVMILGGCATTHGSREWSPPLTVPLRTELDGVPFVAQDTYQCGPASVSMVLAWSGAAVPLDVVVNQVYSPARNGSLATDVASAVRRNGRLAYPISTLSAVILEIAAGNPVVILQDAGTPNHPNWHFAVIVGYDLSRDEVILRSGLTRRAVLSVPQFERTWIASGHWGLVAVDPRRPPATAREDIYLEAAIGLEVARQWQAAAEAYQAAHERWPDSLAALIGLGNSRYRLRDLPGAADAFRLATHMHPDTLIPFTNLAHVLAEMGRSDDTGASARQAAESAQAVHLPLGVLEPP